MADQELAHLLERIEDLLRHYVVFQNDSQVVAVTLWVAHTWIADQADATRSG